MMISPESYLAEYADAPYSELLKLKNELVQQLTDFETDYNHDKLNWTVCPSPDVQYQWNLEVLSQVCLMMKRKFNDIYKN